MLYGLKSHRVVPGFVPGVKRDSGMVLTYRGPKFPQGV